MKKLIILLSFFTIYNQMSAQELGIRVGDVTGNTAAVDMLFSVGEFSRIHADVSFGDGIGVEALYDFLYKPLGPENFNWYVGAGPSMYINDPFFLGFSGEVGLDYHFAEVPISLSADWRPTFWIIENTDMHWGGFGFNARYVFGK